MNPFKLRPNNEINVKKVGLEKSFFADFYHTLMKMSWLQFVVLFILTYLFINTIFATLYYLDSNSILNARPGSFWDAFVFSFQTSASIGYGYLLPNTTYANIIVIFDALSCVLFVAMATGLAFSKFSRPSARVLFSHNMLISKYEGNNILVFRMGNARSSKVIDAKVKVVMSRPEISQEGTSMRRMYDINLHRSESPLFSLSWSVMHIIDEQSPLYKYDLQNIAKEDLNFIISLTGIDDVFSAQVYDRCIYMAKDIKLAKQFTDLISVNKKGESIMDYRKFHSIDY